MIGIGMASLDQGVLGKRSRHPCFTISAYGQSQRIEAKIILGAAVIDDVLALLVLAVVSAVVVTGTFSPVGLFMIGLKAVLFLAGSIGVGLWITPRLVKRTARWEVKNFELLFGLGFAFVLSWLANWIGLATIVGSFAAGLLLGDLFLEELGEEHSLRDLLSPLESLIVPDAGQRGIV